MINTKCAICGNKEKLEVLYPATFNLSALGPKTFSARRTPDGTHYRFVKCANCGLIFSNPILPLDKIAKLYKDSTFDYAPEAEYLKKTYGAVLERMLPHIGIQKTKVLDIGCGNGFFLERAEELGVQHVFGVEPSIPAIKMAPKRLQSKIKASIFKPGLYKALTFDIACCFHTLDHVTDPMAFVKEMYRILNRGGQASVIVHDTGGLSVKLFGEKSPIFDIEHIYLFNKVTLRRIFMMSGFKTAEVFDLENEYPLVYWFRMIPLPPWIKNNLIKLLAFLNLDKVPLKLKSGNIGIVAKK